MTWCISIPHFPRWYRRLRKAECMEGRELKWYEKAVITLYVPPPLPLLPRGGEPRMAHGIMGACPLKKHLPALAFPSSLGGGAGVVGQIRSQPFPPTYPSFSISRLSPFSPNTSTQTFKHPFAEIHRPPNYTHLCTETNPI